MVQLCIIEDGQRRTNTKFSDAAVRSGHTRFSEQRLGARWGPRERLSVSQGEATSDWHMRHNLDPGCSASRPEIRSVDSDSNERASSCTARVVGLLPAAVALARFAAPSPPRSSRSSSLQRGCNTRKHKGQIDADPPTFGAVLALGLPQNPHVPSSGSGSAKAS